MHAILFSLKRAFHRSVRFGQTWLAPVGLTPARFDMLAVIGRHPPHRMPQNDLRSTLGVTAPTVSRMLRSLEQLGLVTREEDLFDRRQRIISLTREGLRRLRCAASGLMDSGAVQLAIDTALVDRWFDRAACLSKGTILEELLRRMRREFGDTAVLTYPWRPGDEFGKMTSSVW